jgi:hypothetical protein
MIGRDEREREAHFHGGLWHFLKSTNIYILLHRDAYELEIFNFTEQIELEKYF